MVVKEQEEVEPELKSILRGEESLRDLHARIALRFRRREVRERAFRFLQGLLAPVERKNGWQLAEELGEHGPRGVQRLLGDADWDEDAVRDDLRAYVVQHLGKEQSVLVIDETGFVKKGKKSVGVARQYSGTAGRRENVQIGVFLLYASIRGYAFLDRSLYLPEEWTQDRVRCQEAGVPAQVEFATKGELAQQMLARAFAAGVLASWVVADTVYGFDEMRQWLEDRQQSYVLAVPTTHQIWVQGQQQPVGLLGALLPEQAWMPLSAGEGSQGPRLYEWAWLEVPDAYQGERKSWVLIRRKCSDPHERAYYRAWGLAETTLAELVRVAGRRWTIEEGFEQAKGEVGLDQYEVRGFRAWYRHITLALLAHAFLVVTRLQAQAEEKKTRWQAQNRSP